MNTVTNEALEQLFSIANIIVADSSRHIGGELSWTKNVSRTIIIHVAENEELSYLSSVVSIVLSMDEEWLIIPRYGVIKDLELPIENTNGAAISFSKDEFPLVVKYLCTRPIHPRFTCADLYVLGENGKIMITWDHHVNDMGIIVELTSIAEATLLLGALNNFGTEFEVFYST